MNLKNQFYVPALCLFLAHGNFAWPYALNTAHAWAGKNVSKPELIKILDKAKEIIRERKNYSNNELARFEAEMRVSTQELNRVSKKLLEVTAKGAEQEIKFWRKIYASELDAEKVARNKWLFAKNLISEGKNLLSRVVSDSFNQKALLLLAESGFNILYSAHGDLDQVFDHIEQTLNRPRSSRLFEP